MTNLHSSAPAPLTYRVKRTHDGRWIALKDGHCRALTDHATEADAIAEAIARLHDGGTILVLNDVGKIRREVTISAPRGGTRS